MASYFTINISSPNTPGLRALQTRAALDDLLGRLNAAAAGLPAAGAVPWFLKVAPDLDDGEPGQHPPLLRTVSGPSTVSW